MDFDIMKASSRLSELDLKITTGNLGINILWFRAMQCSADYTIERHTHSTFEFHFVYEGSSRVVLDHAAFDVKAGEFYLTTPGVHHRQENKKGHIEFSLNCELSTTDDQASEAQFIVNVLQTSECRPIKDIAGAMDIFHKALEEAYYQNIGFYNNIRSLAVMLIMASARAIGGARQLNMLFRQSIKRMNIDSSRSGIIYVIMSVCRLQPPILQSTCTLAKSK